MKQYTFHAYVRAPMTGLHKNATHGMEVTVQAATPIEARVMMEKRNWKVLTGPYQKHSNKVY